jgi:hypothetical protein
MNPTPASDDASPLGSLGSLLGPPRGKWGQRVATAAAAYALGQKTWSWAQERQRQRGYTIAVYDSDAIYGPVQAWVLERMPADQQRALIAVTERRHEPRRVAPSPSAASGRLVQVYRELRLHFDGTRSQDVGIGDHTVKVSVERDDPAGGRSSDETSGYSASWRPAKIVFSCSTLAARDAVVRFLQQAANDIEARKAEPNLYTSTTWGDWRHLRDMPPRPLDSVVLKAGQLEALVDDLQRFYASEQQYVQLGIPWHRGYVFHGPPGTGKTSTAKALAAHLGLDLYYVPLSDLSKDANLNQLIGSVDQRAVLLLEDIDVVHGARERDDTASGVSLSGLLNALDGVVTPHGLVTIMTTNDIGVLDEALLRPGRADRREYMGYLDEEQFCRLVWALTGRIAGAPLDLKDRGLTAADVVEIVKRHLEHPADAIPALEALAAGSHNGRRVTA